MTPTKCYIDDSLTSAKSLTLPEGVEVVWLNGLTSPDGLVLPESVRTVYLNGLTDTDKATVQRQYPGATVF